ncbi:hypothetical protein A0H76_1401 [Hepatospora eriocheir]|nr:hypothetical protein A0H76_1401 [Hepatospora eriocheir]
MKKYHRLLNIEVEFLNNLIYRGNNQFKNNLRHRKMILLSRLIKKSNYSKIVNTCEDIYIICSSEAVLGHFLDINFTVMALVARIRYLIIK